MKYYLFCIVILSTSLGVSAQTPPKPSRWSIALTAGPAFPVGGFAGIHNSEFGTDGSVAFGGSAEAAFTYRISRFLSAIVAANGQLNHGHGIPQTSDYAYLAGEAPHIAPFGDYWQMARFLAGGVFTFPLSKRGGPALLFRAMAGIQHTRIPDFEQTDPEEFPGYHYVLYARSPGDWPTNSFSYELDAGLEWRLHGRWAFITYAGYNGSRLIQKPILLGIPGPIMDPLLPGPRSTTNILPLSTFAIRAGVEFGL